MLVVVNELKCQIYVLRLRNKELLQEVEVLRQENVGLKAESELLKEEILSMRQKLFGKKQDEVPKAVKRRLKFETSSLKKKAGRKRINKEDCSFDEERYYDYEAAPKCECCNKEMKKIGKNESYHEDLEIVHKKIKLSQAKYACKECNKIKTVKGARLPIAKAKALAGLLAQVVVDKCSKALPTYRQSEDYKDIGIEYSRQMLCSWIMAAGNLIAPLTDLMFRQLTSSSYNGG